MLTFPDGRRKNLFCLLLLANGVPMFTAGDEFLQTQGGNNNPYNQDNETTWLNWSRKELHADQFRFAKQMIAFRKSHRSIGRTRFWRDDVHWYGVGRDVDLSHESRSVAYCLHGASHGDCDLYVMINAYHEPLDFEIQEKRPGRVATSNRHGAGQSPRHRRSRERTPGRFVALPGSTPLGGRPSRSGSVHVISGRIGFLRIMLASWWTSSSVPRSSRDAAKHGYITIAAAIMGIKILVLEAAPASFQTKEMQDQISAEKAARQAAGFVARSMNLGLSRELQGVIL